MSYVLTFKTKELEKKQRYIGKIYDTEEQAQCEANKLNIEGYNGQAIIYTSIQEGRK
jgi:hypothetical protein